MMLKMCFWFVYLVFIQTFHKYAQFLMTRLLTYNPFQSLFWKCSLSGLNLSNLQSLTWISRGWILSRFVIRVTTHYLSNSIKFAYLLISACGSCIYRHLAWNSLNHCHTRNWHFFIHQRIPTGFNPKGNWTSGTSGSQSCTRMYWNWSPSRRTCLRQGLLKLWMGQLFFNVHHRVYFQYLVLVVKYIDTFQDFLIA